MARQQRQKSGSGIYHVMVRGVNKQIIFERDADFNKMLDIIESVHLGINDDGTIPSPSFRLYAWCIMKTHMHLLIRECPLQPLSIIIQRITSSYAQYYNTLYGRTGHLFQGRFKSIPVNDRNYFGTVFAYIHQNPVKDAIVYRPEDYPWSSWREIQGHQPSRNLCDVGTLRRCVGIDTMTDWVNWRLPDNIDCLDIDNENHERAKATTETKTSSEPTSKRQRTRKGPADEVVKAILYTYSHATNIPSFQRLTRNEQNNALRMAMRAGCSNRHLQHITGLTYYQIEQVRKNLNSIT